MSELKTEKRRSLKTEYECNISAIKFNLQSSDPDWPKTVTDKEGRVFPMAILYEFRLREYRDEDFRKDAPYFTERLQTYQFDKT